MSQAHAADFTGRIKTIRIKKRRTGSGFKVRVVTQADTAGSVDSAELTLRDATSGEVLEQLTLDEPSRARVLSSHADTPVLPGDDITVTISAQSLDHNGDPFGEQQEFEVSVDGLEVGTVGRSAEGDGGEGWKVRTRITSAGALQLVVLNEDRGWSGAGVTDVSYTVNGGADAYTAEVDEVRQRLKANLSADLTDLGSVQVDTTLLDADGVVLDTRSSTVGLSLTTADPGLEKVRVKETNSGAPKLVSWTRSDGQDTSLDVEMVDNATGEVVLTALDDSPVASERGYFMEGLEFDPGESPQDYVYLVLLDLINAEGDPVGEQYEVELTVPGMGEGGQVGSAYMPFADGLGAISFLVDSEGYGVHVALNTSDLPGVEDVNVIFEEPYEGPAPLETEVTTVMVHQADKWMQKGTGALPDDYTLTTTLLAEDGTVLETSTSSGGGAGVQYSTTGNGKGTRKGIKLPMMIHIELL